METQQRRGRFESGRLAVALIALVALPLLGVAVWMLALDGSDEDEDEPDLVAMAEATLTARSIATDATSTPIQAVSATQPMTPALMFETATAGAACPADEIVSGKPAGLPFGADSSHPDWYGDSGAGLWAAPVKHAVYVPDEFPAAPGLWYAGDTTLIVWYGSAAPVQVTAERLDGEERIGPVEPSESFEENRVYWTTLAFPTPGCWTITGSSDEGSLAITVEVLPLEQRPDIAYASALNSARPYETPANCPVDPWIGPESRDDEFLAHFWLESGEVSADISGDLLVANRESIMGVYGFDPDAEFTATARRLNTEAVEIIDAIVQSQPPELRIVRYAYPTPGCWELELSTPETTATFVVYVYPQECAPLLEAGEIRVAACEPPRS